MLRAEEIRLFVEESILLAEEQLGIEEIREIELVPHISVFEEQEKILIDGDLICQGSYRGRERHGMNEQAFIESKRGIFAPWNQTGEILHEIPVKIEIAKERVEDLEKVYVRIDSFDYDLLDPYQLLVTAELCIEGVKGVASEAAPQMLPFEQGIWEGWNEQKLAIFALAEEPERKEEVEFMVTESTENIEQVESTENIARAHPGAAPLFRFHESMQRNLFDQSNLSAPSGDQEQEGEEDIQASDFAATDLNERTGEEDVEQREETKAESALPSADEDGGEEEAQLSSLQPVASEEEPEKASAEGAVGENVERVEPVEGMERIESIESVESVEASEEQGGEQTEERVQPAVHLTEESFAPVEEEGLGQGSSREAVESEMIAEAVESAEEHTESPAPPEVKVTIGKQALSEAEADHSQMAMDIFADDEQLEVEATEHSADESAENELRNYLYPDREDGPTFTKLKVCIVQRDETLFEIAQRYELTPKEIMEFNRLTSAELTSGQLLYIPQMELS